MKKITNLNLENKKLKEKGKEMGLHFLKLKLKPPPIISKSNGGLYLVMDGGRKVEDGREKGSKYGVEKRNGRRKEKWKETREEIKR